MYKPIDQYTEEELAQMKPWEVCFAYELLWRIQQKKQEDMPLESIKPHEAALKEMETIGWTNPDFVQWVRAHKAEIFPEGF